MSYALFAFVPLATIALCQSPMVPKAGIIGLIDSVVTKAAGKSVPAIQSVQATQKLHGLQASPTFLNATEKVAILKAMNVSPSLGTAPPTILNLSVKNPFQILNGVTAATNYRNPSVVFTDTTPGVVLFGKSTTMFSGAGLDPALIIQFRPLPNKRYLIEAPMAGNGGSYYVHVQVDNGTAFQQTMANATRLLIVFPGTTKPQESYIAVQGNIPGIGAWAWYGCQITEI